MTTKTIYYFYNEHLPKKTAHDPYIIHNCASLAHHTNVNLVIGHQSLNKESLEKHYGVKFPQKCHLISKFLIRKMGLLKTSWNLPFFYRCQNLLKKDPKKGFVALSVLKQAKYHFSRKISNFQYIYEVHQLSWYTGDDEKQKKKEIAEERSILEKADLIVTTTKELKDILQNYPYNLSNRIEVIPLGTHKASLPPITHISYPIKLFYVGQLYQEQGISFLTKVWKRFYEKNLNIELHIVGGKPHEISHLEQNTPNITYHGFVNPSQLHPLLQQAHGFIAPFTPKGKMSFVAHTKLYEYLMWKRPIILPKIPHTENLMRDLDGIFFYNPESDASLNETLSLFFDNIEASILKASLWTCNYSWENRARLYWSLLESMSS